MSSTILCLLLSHLFFSFLVSSAPLPVVSTCTPSTSSIPHDIRKFRLQVDGSAEGEPELQIAWEFPRNRQSPGHLVLSDDPMTAPLLNFLNGNGGGKLCNQRDLCSDLQAFNDPNSFDSLAFTGGDQNARPAFAIKNICDLEGQPAQILVPRNDTGYSSFAVTSFGTGSQLMLRKNGQVGIGSNVNLKIMQSS
ncbi:hypothetical protein MMC14_002651 [Varicellaria rhodocarpa]|nr:hypothetical protein [Varicellaria rhodocarpa]